MRKKGWIRGKYHNDIGGNNADKAYRVWIGMIKRCEGGYQECYQGVTLCDEWHTLSNFKRWYDRQECPDNWQVDKDFLHKGGSKVYSHTTCTMIPSYVNSVIGFRDIVNSNGVRGVTKAYESVKGKGTLYVAAVSEFRRDGKVRIIKTRGKDSKDLHHWYQRTKANQIENCRNYYAREQKADSRVLERMTEIAWWLRLKSDQGVITNHIDI